MQNLRSVIHNKPYSHFGAFSNKCTKGKKSPLKSDTITYSFAFNGQEKIDEVNGAGNDLDFGARIYDPRLGRWMSCDPFAKKYTDLSPYNFVANSPIIAVDPDGKIIKIVGSAEFIRNTNAFLEMIRATDKGKLMVEALEKTDAVYTFEETSFLLNSSYNQKENLLTYDDSPWISSLDGGAMNGLIALAHELAHAYFDHNNSNGIVNDQVINRSLNEKEAVRFQNYITSVYSLGDSRLRYTGRRIFSATSTEKTFNPSLEKISNFKYQSDWVNPPTYSVNPNPAGTYAPTDNTSLSHTVCGDRKRANVSYDKSRDGGASKSTSEKVASEDTTLRRGKEESAASYLNR